MDYGLPGGPWTGLRRVQVLALNYARKPHKRWSGWVLEDTPDRIVTYRPPQAPVLMGDRDSWATQAPAVCVFWSTRHYTLSYLLDAEQQVHGYYVNVTTPPVRRAGYLEYVDLDLGLLVGPNLEYTVDSETGLAGYPAPVQAQARTALDGAIALVEARDPLFTPPQAWLALLDEEEGDPLSAIAAMLRGPDDLDYNTMF
jgi:hypothetical protein